MGGVLAKIVFKSGKDSLDQNKYQSINEIPVTTVEGQDYEKLIDLVGDKKLYLIVNTASKWGIAHKNWKQLVQVHQEYKDKGVEIIAVPCN